MGLKHRYSRTPLDPPENELANKAAKQLVAEGNYIGSLRFVRFEKETLTTISVRFYNDAMKTYQTVEVTK